MSVRSVRRETYPLLDAIRAIAAVMVVTRHTPLFFPVQGGKSYLAVDMFFVLSGLVVANAYEHKLLKHLTTSSFFRIRFVRLFPLYVLGLTIGLVAASASLHPHIVPLPMLTVALNAVMIPRLWPMGAFDIYPFNPPSWSLLFELGINLVYASCLRWLSDRRIAILVAVMAIGLVAILFLRSVHALDGGFQSRQMPVGIVRVGFSFFAGVLIFRKTRNGPPLWVRGAGNWRLTAVLITLLVLVMVPTISGIASAMWEAVTVILVFPGMIYIAMWLRFDVRTTRVFAFLGMASYTIYVIHMPLYALITSMVERQGWTLPPTLVTGPLFTIGLFAAAYLLDRFYDTPMRRLFGRVVR